jgi:putative peptidoglycan lipid II flippase
MALATSIATWTNASLLYLRLRKRGEHQGDAELRRRLPRLMISALGMAIVTFLLTMTTKNTFEMHALIPQIEALLVLIGLSSLVYAALLHLTGAFRLGDAIKLIRKKEA